MCTPSDTTETTVYANRYQQVKKLGQGSFGTVYLVHDLRSKHDKKVLKAIFVGDISREESSEAEHEAALLARLRHPHILRFYDSFMDAPYYSIVTEYCEDGDLDQFLKSLRKQRSRLQVDQVIDLFIQLLSAVVFLHSKKILHRDIKTSNIFLKRNQLKLGDFGISRLMMNTIDKASTFIGTPFYMSPEALKYDGYNIKADIWSLGCILYELSMCKRAFERPNIIQAMEAILHDTPPSLPERLPARARELYTNMMSREPDERLPASELLDEFRKMEIESAPKSSLTKQSSTPDSGLKPPHPEFHRSFSNSPLVNKHLRNPLQTASPVHSASSVDSLDSVDNVPLDDLRDKVKEFDPFSSEAKQMKIDFNRSKAQELVGPDTFDAVYSYLQTQRRQQTHDDTRTDDILLSGLQTICPNATAGTLIDELVLYECLNEMNERCDT